MTSAALALSLENVSAFGTATKLVCDEPANYATDVRSRNSASDAADRASDNADLGAKPSACSCTSRKRRSSSDEAFRVVQVEGLFALRAVDISHNVYSVSVS